MDRFCCLILLTAFAPLTFAQNKLPVESFYGNPRDPLNARFAVNANAENPYSEMTANADLNDVCFINPRKGWAVGDHGIVWHTDDGGTTWQQQETPIDCTLRSVQFFDESFGIAAGNYWFPLTKQGRGVILTTLDGGKTWTLKHSPDLPPIYRIKIFDAMNILAAGATTEHCPSGLLFSNDGGQNWKPMSIGLSDGFAAADFFDTKNGIGIGFHGAIQQFQGNITLSQTASFGQYQISAVKVNKPTSEFDVTGWAVGDRGLILSTVDQGYRWGVLPRALPGNAAVIVDLKTIESHGKNLWVAGSPGTCIYMSNDAGQTWKSTLTGVSATIRKIVFTDPNNGWAVGDLGIILATNNGGQTWNEQQPAAPARVKSAKLAVLGLFGQADSVPLEALASLCANQGYLGGCILLFRNENYSREPMDRFHDAVIRTGGSISAELGAFPLLRQEVWMSSEKLVEHIQKQTDGKGMQNLRERLVAVIRQYKPEIILTSNYTNPYIDSIVEEIVLREVMEAVKLAEDSSVFPYQLTELGLSAWKVKKVYLALKNGALGDVHLVTSEPTLRFGVPIEELTFIANELIETKKKERPAILGFMEVLQNGENVPKDFFAGIPILPGENARRHLIGSYAEFQDENLRRTLQRRNVLGILRNTAKQSEESGRQTNRASIVSHAVDLTRKLDQDAAVQILLEMAKQFHDGGDWYAASETCQVLAKQHAYHPLIRQAFVRLMQYAASEEIGLSENQNNVAVTQQDELVADPKRPGRKIVQTSVVREPIREQYRTDSRLNRALILEQMLEQQFPDIADDVSVRFAVAAALRKQNWEQDAAKFYRTRGSLKFDDVWGTRARAEYWLTLPDKSELPLEQRELPMPAFVCPYTKTKPFLDGKFDDEKDKGVWNGSNLYLLTPEKPRQRLAELLQSKENENSNSAARRIGVVRENGLRAANQNFGTQTMFLYDEEFLYIGLRCPKVLGIVYPPAAGKQRVRDAAMPDQDRIEILLDTDRDYGTYYSLTIDSRGWVTDACFGDRNWNPSWHVARYDDKDAWYIEAAIPFASLSDRVIQRNTVWGVAVRRLVPGAGIECWNAENSFGLAEGFGLLIFP